MLKEKIWIYFLFFFWLYWRMTPKISPYTLQYTFKYTNKRGMQAVTLLLFPQTNPFPISCSRIFCVTSTFPEKQQENKAWTQNNPFPKNNVPYQGEWELEREGLERKEREKSCFDAARGLEDKKEGGTFKSLRGEELCNCKYAIGMLPTISKDLRFQNHPEG